MTRPKPMVEIGGKPLLWHIMNIYASHGHRDFLVAAGYKGEMIKEYVSNFFLYNSDFSVSTKDGTRRVLNPLTVDWNISVVDTGLETMTGGRLLRLGPLLGREPFMLTYGDGLADVDIGALLAFHRRHGKLATITGVRPPSRFGELLLDGEAVVDFSEKPQTRESWINGGFFVLEPGVLDYLGDDATVFEEQPLRRLAREGQLMVHCHTGFWQAMDTLREKMYLDALWNNGRAPWKVWT